jgi:nucleotide-binding universal stress UspA family protein
MKYRKVVVGIDFSEASLRALETALNLELAENGRLYLVHVVDGPVSTVPPFGELTHLEPDVREGLDEKLKEFIPENYQALDHIETVILHGPPSRQLAQFAESVSAEMIVTGTRGLTGLSRILLGSTAEHLLRVAPCQVLVVKPHSYDLEETAGEDSELESHAESNR